MLGKLLKHEIRHSARYTMAIYAAAFAAMAVTGISLLLDSGWLGVLSCVALYVVGFASLVVTLVSVIKNFYDTLFSRQGYLTLTLPVKGSTLLLSKIIVSFERLNLIIEEKSRSRMVVKLLLPLSISRILPMVIFSGACLLRILILYAAA